MLIISNILTAYTTLDRLYAVFLYYYLYFTWDATVPTTVTVAMLEVCAVAAV